MAELKNKCKNMKALKKRELAQNSKDDLSDTDNSIFKNSDRSSGLRIKNASTNSQSLFGNFVDFPSAGPSSKLFNF